MINIPPNPLLDQAFVSIYLKSGDAVASIIRSGHALHGFDPRDVADSLLARSDILGLITESQKKVTRSPSEITRESIVTDFENIHSAAIAEKDYAAAIAAKKNQAQILGLIQENVQITHRMDVTSMSDEQLMKLLVKKSKQIEAPMIDITPQPVGLGSISAAK